MLEQRSQPNVARAQLFEGPNLLVQFGQNGKHLGNFTLVLFRELDPLGNLALMQQLQPAGQTLSDQLLERGHFGFQFFASGGRRFVTRGVILCVLGGCEHDLPASFLDLPGHRVRFLGCGELPRRQPEWPIRTKGTLQITVQGLERRLLLPLSCQQFIDRMDVFLRQLGSEDTLIILQCHPPTRPLVIREQDRCRLFHLEDARCVFLSGAGNPIRVARMCIQQAGCRIPGNSIQLIDDFRSELLIVVLDQLWQIVAQSAFTVEFSQIGLCPLSSDR